jgi:hypothetical protein
VTDAAQPSPLRLLTSDEAGDHVGLAGGYLTQLVAAGELTPFAIAGRRRINLFTREGLDEFTRRRAAKRSAHSTSFPRSAA